MAKNRSKATGVASFPEPVTVVAVVRLQSSRAVLPLLLTLACEAEQRDEGSVADAAAASGDTPSVSRDASESPRDASAASPGEADAASHTSGKSETTNTNTGGDSLTGDASAAVGSTNDTGLDPSSDRTAGDRSAAPDAGTDSVEPVSGACEPNALRCRDESSPEICDADQVWRPLLACEAPLRCSSGQCAPALDKECPLLLSLPRFTGSQVIDGDDADFLDVPAVTYSLLNAPVGNLTYRENLPTTVSVRMAWTPAALVAHVHVTDPALQTYQGEILEYYWQGDNVQFFAAPTDLLTGKYSGTEDGNAIHLVIVPPSGAQPSRAIEVYEPCYACVDAQFSSVPYAARATTDGYDVEFAWPWTPPNGPLVTGDRIGLNLIVGASDTPNSGLELEGLLANNEVGDDTPCGGATHPGCDDRTWCYATLE